MSTPETQADAEADLAALRNRYKGTRLGNPDTPMDDGWSAGYVLGEIGTFKPHLFPISKCDNRVTYINLNHVSRVTYWEDPALDGSILMVVVVGEVGYDVTDPEIVSRFFEEWEVL